MEGKRDVRVALEDASFEMRSVPAPFPRIMSWTAVMSCYGQPSWTAFIDSQG